MKKLVSALLALIILTALFPALAAADADRISVRAGEQTLYACAASDAAYIFLPSGCDLTRLSIDCPKAGDTVKGAKTSVKSGESFDLTKLAAEKNGVYSLTYVSGGSPRSLKIMCADSIGTVYIKSSDAVKRGRDYVDSEKGLSTDGSMTLVSADGKTVVYDGSLTQIKSRGNSSFFLCDKKSYQIKLGTKADLLGTGEKNKTFVLLASFMDATKLRDKFFKDLAADMGMYGSPDCDWVNLYYDGEYRGVYIVSEKASVGSATVDITDMEKAYEKLDPDYGDGETSMTGTNKYGSRVKYTVGLKEPADISGGWLIELNGTRGIDEASGFTTARQYRSVNYTFNIKSPEYAGKTAVEYISSYFQEFEDAVYAQSEDRRSLTGRNAKTGKYFYEYCDLDSLVKMFLIQQLAASPDGFYASTYFYKDAGGLLNAGPLWDMDLSAGTGMEGDISATNSFLCSSRYLSQALIQIPAFQKALREYYDGQFRALAQSYIDTVLDAYADTLRTSVAMDHVLWPYVRTGNPESAKHLYGRTETYASLVKSMKTWLTDRLAYTDKVVSHEHKYTVNAKKELACRVCGAMIPDEPSPHGDPTAFPFTDVSASSYCREAVEWAYVNGVTTGYSDNTFRPNDTCTRGHVVTFLWRAAGQPEPESLKNPFKDVSKSSPFYKAILWAAEKGITTGYSDGTFRPNAACTRAHVVTFLWRYHDKPAAAGSVKLRDLKGLSADFTNAIKWAASTGITTGYADGSFKPNAICTRAHVVTFLYRDMVK